MSTEKSHDPFAAIHNRYGLVQAAQSLPQRLTTTEIAQLAYPDDTADNDRFQLVIKLGKAIDRGELEAFGTAAPPAYLTTQGVKYGPRQPLIAREAFARFLTVMGTVLSGRLAEWISPPDEPEQPPISARLAEKTASQQAQSQERPQAGPGAPMKNLEAYRYMDSLIAEGSNPKAASLVAASRYFPEADLQAKAESLRKGYRQWKTSQAKSDKSP